MIHRKTLREGEICSEVNLGTSAEKRADELARQNYLLLRERNVSPLNYCFFLIVFPDFPVVVEFFIFCVPTLNFLTVDNNISRGPKRRAIWFQYQINLSIFENLTLTV